MDKRNVEENLPVTPNTIFAIGSSSKAFTATSAAIAVEDGKLEWDKPVREYLPTFKMKDDFASERMTLRDLLCHRSGLPRHDLSWYNTPATREQIIDRVRYLEPTSDFRTNFQYQNLMYMTAGYLAGLVDGTTWEELVRERIFKPLGMTHSQFSVEDSQKSDNYALPYNEKDDKVKKIEFRNIDTVGPAGSINSNVVDMIEWVRLQLKKGKVGEANGLLRGQRASTPFVADGRRRSAVGTGFRRRLDQLRAGLVHQSVSRPDDAASRRQHRRFLGAGLVYAGDQRGRGRPDQLWITPRCHTSSSTACTTVCSAPKGRTGALTSRNSPTR